MTDTMVDRDKIIKWVNENKAHSLSARDNLLSGAEYEETINAEDFLRLLKLGAFFPTDGVKKK